MENNLQNIDPDDIDFFMEQFRKLDEEIEMENKTNQGENDAVSDTTEKLNCRKKLSKKDANKSYIPRC